jgi:hygromycin-B 7''-O-kinase
VAGRCRFLSEQSARCVPSQSAHGLAPAWLEQIPRFLAATTLPRPAREVLLHTEIMRAHLFAQRGPSGWSLSGLVDFEPAMVGDPEYEFAAVGLFLSCGDGPALRALLLAYGYHPADLGPALQRRFLAYALLHRYSNLRWYLERRPLPAATTLDDLAAAWWALGDESEVALAPQHRP